jgi:hypothetical protein
MTCQRDASDDDTEPPMDRAALLLFATAVVVSWLAAYAVYRACVALIAP